MRPSSGSTPTGKFLSTFLASLLAAVLIASPLTAALEASSDSDSEGIEDESFERVVVGGEAGTAFEFRSRSTHYQQNDEFHLTFDRGHLEFEYAREAGSLETELGLRLEFEQLFAFTDRNVDGRYDAGEPISALLELDHVAWAESTATEVSNPDGSIALEFEASTADGTFALVALASPHPYLGGGQLLSPTTIKLTFEIRGFPEGGESDAVGLLIEAEISGESPSLVYEAAASRLLATAGDGNATFSWGANATVDGESTGVGATYSAGTLIFSYVQGGEILHDPLLGVRSLAPSSGRLSALSADPLVFAGSLAAAIGLLTLLAVRYRRSRREP